MNHWTHANHQLIAKAIGELHFEEILSPVAENGAWKVELKSGVTYHFQGRMGSWGHLWVQTEGLKRSSAQGTELELSAGQFFIDTRAETGMSDITLATFIEEMNNTLYCDTQLLQQETLTAREMTQLADVKLQQRLPGHPKLLLNKGRMGWSAEDLKRYSPESGESFQLHWILVHDSKLVGSETVATERQDGYRLMPVHPWQWDNVIAQQFQSEIAQKMIISLGVSGDFYSPQTSLRTLSNVDHPTKPDLKLPLSILNTSCVRGLPQKYLSITPELSQVLTRLLQEDALLQNVSVLNELSAWGYQHPLFHQVAGASYRYHEQLGAVWRESVSAKLQSGEQAVLSASLFHRDSQGVTMLTAFAQEAGISVEAWLQAYARQVILPLYHLQLKYGIGVVAHGQNIVVRLKQGTPVGLILKDFHGDLRLSSAHQSLHQSLFPQIVPHLTQLPPEHLIHDLITGHFITTFRFIAGALEDSKVLSEARAHQILAKEIETYQKQHAELVKPHTNLLAKIFPKVLVNKVRFKIGYGDNAERPLPMLGQELINPFFRELHS